MARKFREEKFRKTLKTITSQFRIFIDESDPIISENPIILDTISDAYPDYMTLIERIESKVQRRKPNLFDDIPFRIDVKKLMLLLIEILNKLPDEEIYSSFRSDINSLMELIKPSLDEMESCFGKDCYWGKGGVTLTD